jgi:UDP-N-acetylglucosamine 2-epimerase
VREALAGIALLQFPWSARAMDEAGAALDALQPSAALTYAEAGGWGRALALESRRRGIPMAGLQHGFIYRHWLNYQHEPDELEARGADAGFPAPDRTLVFDGWAARHLERAGHLPRAGVVVTGSAQLDALSARIAAIDAEARARTRASLGVAPDGRLVVLAAKFTELGDAFRALVAAVNDRPGIRLVVKTHPAETPAPYRREAEGLDNVTIAGADSDLATLIAAADGVVTRNSTVAIDAMALGMPALVIGLPSNLSPFVDAGVMLGARTGADVGRGLDALLYDLDARRALIDAAQRFRDEHRMHTDGRAAERAADAILGVRSS